MANPVGTILALLVIVIAYCCYKHVTGEDKRIIEVLDGLKALERTSLKGPPKVASGFASTIDYFVDAMELFEAMDFKPPDKAKPHDIVKNERELLETFVFFFNHSAASSRYIADKELFHKITKKVLGLKTTIKAVGGNGLQISKRLAKEGCHVLAAAHSADHEELQGRLPENITLAGVVVDVDDVHMLLEYPAHVKWGRYQSHRANRLVIHSDEHNPFLKSLEKFQEKVQEFSPSVLVISGLHILDNFPGFNPGERNRILERLISFLESTKIPIHFEMSPLTEDNYFDKLIQYIIPYASSLGMNEQELPNLRNKLHYGNITLISSQKIRVAQVLDLMRDIYKNSKETFGSTRKRQLTRLHVHTLAFQAILTTKGLNWKNTKAATAKASLTATRHVCGSEEIDPRKCKLLMDDSFSKSIVPGSPRVPFRSSSPVSCWDEDDYELCVAPVLVCTQVLQTGGGGDHVTAGGLVLQI